MSGSPVRLAVLGDPLAFTLSPVLHRAGFEALGVAGESAAMPTPPASLAARLDELAGLGFLGVNLTRPHKAAVLPHLARISAPAREAVSVNTVGFGPDGPWGDTTDGAGLIDLLTSLGRPPAGQRAVLLGAGGAARSLALALAGAGAPPATVSARSPAAVADDWRRLPGATIVPWRSPGERDALAAATLVVNATPLAGNDAPAPLEGIAPRALVLDLNYGERPGDWVARARAQGREAYDGLGLLVFQARRSLALWFSRPVPVEPLARAVGWPR